MSSIKYVSTRGADKNTSFKDAVLRGLASDGGLLVPQNIPIIPLDALELWKQLSFSQLAVEVMSCFIGEDQIPKQDLQNIVDASYNNGKWRSPNITPSKS